MILVLDISTSAEFWRQRYPLDREPSAPSPKLPSDCAVGKRNMTCLIPPWVDDEFLEPLGGMLHTLSFDVSKKRRSDTHAVHVWSGPIPDGSFYELKDGTFVMSPCFMFLVAASILDIYQLIAFGDELCGLYSFDRREERGFRKRSVPLTETRKLAAYLGNAKGCRGRRRALSALAQLVDRSASPMETFDEMAMCLPYRLGGYGIPRFLMNIQIPLTSRAKRIAQRETCYLDMGCLDPKLDVEHHGKHDHSTSEEMMQDRARVNALKEMGFEVTELTFRQVDDLIAFEIIIQRLAKRLHKRIDKTKLGATPERLEMRTQVLAWNQSSGKIR